MDDARLIPVSAFSRAVAHNQYRAKPVSLAVSGHLSVARDRHLHPAQAKIWEQLHVDVGLEQDMARVKDWLPALKEAQHVVSLRITGYIGTAAHLDTFYELLHHFPFLQCLDLSDFYPLEPGLVTRVLKRLAMLHELHLNLMPSGGHRVKGALALLSADPDLTVEHLELHHCGFNPSLTLLDYAQVYAFPYLKRVAFRDYKRKDVVPLAAGYDKALTWDSATQTWSERNSWLEQRNHEWREPSYTLYVARTEARLHPYAMLPHDPDGLRRRLTVKGLERCDRKWGYARHGLSLQTNISSIKQRMRDDLRR